MDSWQVGATIGNTMKGTANNIIGLGSQYMNMLYGHNEATLAWKRGLEQWNRENEYNSPKAQMERLREAGINPALAYASGAFNQAAPSPDASTPSMPGNFRPENVLVDPTTQAQVGVLNAQRRAVEAEAEGKEIDNQYKASDWVLRLSERRTAIEKINSDMQVNAASIRNLDAQAKLALQKEITEQVSQQVMLNEDGRKYVRLASDLAEAKSRINLNNASAEVQRSIKRLNEQQYDYLMQANALTLVGLEWDNEIKHQLSLLNIDEHNINELNATLLGFKVHEGRIDDVLNVERFHEVNGDNGVFARFSRRGLQALYHVVDNVSPLK